jgi:hypothetical protein
MLSVRPIASRGRSMPVTGTEPKEVAVAARLHAAKPPHGHATSRRRHRLRLTRRLPRRKGG